MASLLFSLTGTGFAAYPDGVAPAAERMAKLGLVRGRSGDPTDLALNMPITRAELVTVIVRAFGFEEDAKFLRGSATFPDTAQHWASGEIALANNMIRANGYSMGMPDGTFSPDGSVTAAQAVAFLVKFLGVPFDGAKPWPNNYLDAAVSAKLITTEDRVRFMALGEAPAPRGLVFYVADNGFSSYNIAEGKTVYTKYVKSAPPTVTLDSLPQTTPDSRVTVSGTVSSDVISVTVGGKTASLSGGRFTGAVDLTPGENRVAVQANDLVGNTATAQVLITRGDPKPAVIDAPAAVTVGVGQAVDLPVTVKDAAGNQVSGATVSATSDWGTFTAGRFTAGSKVGAGSLTLRVGDVVKTVSVTITAGPLAKITVSPATVDLASGASQKYTVTGEDQFGNPVSLSSGVAWSSSRGIMSPDGTFGATTDAAGTVTITARSGSVSGTATATVYGAGVRIAASAPGGLVANGVSKGQLTITVVDGGGNIARSYNGAVTVVTGNTSIAALASSSVQITNGVGTVEVTAGTVPGTASISISGTGVTGAVALVTTIAPSAASIQLTADPASMAADSRSSTTVTAVLIDQTGNPVRYTPSGTYTLDFVTSDSTQTIMTPATINGVPMTLDGVTGKFQGTTRFYARNNIGAVSVTATLKKDGIVIGTAATTISTLLVGVPYRLAIDPVADAATAGTNAQQRVTVRILDVHGNQVTAAGSSITDGYVITDLLLVKNTGATAVLPTKVGNTNAGTWTGGKAVFLVTDTRAETVTYSATATWSGITLASASAVGKFASGGAARVTLEANPRVINANGVSTSTLTAKITDLNGNPVPDGSYPVTFRRTGGSAMIGWADTTVYSVGGTASVVVRAGNGLGTDTFVAEVSLSNTVRVSAADSVTATIIGVPSQIRFGALATSTAGTEAVIPVQVLDANGVNVVTYDNSTVITLTVTAPDGSTQSQALTSTNGIATFKLPLEKVGSYTLKATATGLKGATGNAGENGAAVQLVAAAAPAAIVLKTNVATLSADNASMALIMASLVDAYGNPASPSASYNLDGLALTSSATSLLALNGGITYYKADGTTVTAVAAEMAVAKAYFRTTSLPGAVTITGQKAGLTSAYLNITTIFGGYNANRMAVSVDTSRKVTVDPAAKQLQKVSVTLQDYAGNRVTNPGASAFAKLTATGTGTMSMYLDEAGTQPYVDGVNNRPQFTITNAGEVSFWVTNTKAETVEYRAELYSAAMGGTLTSSVSAGVSAGSFTPGDPYQIGVVAMPYTVRGDGSSIAVATVTIQDRTGNQITDAAGTMKIRIPAAQGFTHAYIDGAASDGWYTASVASGQAIAIVRARYTTNSSDVFLEADYWAAGASSATLHAAPARALTIGSGSDSAVPLVNSVTTNRQTNGTVTAGDSFVVTFNEPTNMPPLVISSFTLPATRSLGAATFNWNANGTVLTITTGAGVNLAQGDTIRFAATDTITDAASNPFGLGTLFTVDVTAPTVTNVAVNRSVPGAVTAGDSYVLTFSEPTQGSALTNASFATTSGGKFGDSAQFAWNPANTVLTITVGTGGAMIQNGDAVSLATATTVRDIVGIGTGTAAFHTVDLNALTVSGVRVNRAADNQFGSGDTLVLTFSRASTGAALTAADFDVQSAGGARTGAFGTGAQFQWSAGNTVLTITGAGTPTLQTGDTIRLASGGAVRDAGGNPLGTGLLWTADLTAPALSNVKVTRATDSVFAAGDTVEFTFSEPTTGPTDLAAADFVITGGRGFGTGATFAWNPARTVLTVTAGAAPTLAEGDAVALASAPRIKDPAGNNAAATALWTADVTAPTVQGVAVTRATDNVFAADDTIVITLPEAMNAPVNLSEADFIVHDSLGAERAGCNCFGTGATFTWNPARTQLTITGKGTPGLQTGDTVALRIGSRLADLSGIPFGTGLFFTADFTAPVITAMTVTRAVNGQFTSGDTIRLTFDGPTNAPTNLVNGDFVVKDATDNIHTFDTSTFTWNPAKTVLTITAAGAPTVQTGDTVSLVLSTRIRDDVGLAAGTDTIFTVDLSTNTLTATAAANANGAPGVGLIEPGDTITFTFDKAFVTPVDPDLTLGEILLSAGSFGTGATGHWTDGKHLVITLGAAPTITGGETVTFSAAYANSLTDEHGIKAGTTLGTVPAAAAF